MLGNEGLAIQVLGPAAPGPVRVDFASSRMTHRRRGGQNELLGRAVGVGKLDHLTVVDATAGLGGDSYVLADLGCNVISLERSKLIHALLEDGLRRGSVGDADRVRQACSRIRLHGADALDYLPGQQVDVVYLDPMFPGGGKKARARKEMWLFQQLLEAQTDAEELLAAALASARYRVVVKRPLKAPPLSGHAPSSSIKGKAIRFDIYGLRSFNRQSADAAV